MNPYWFITNYQNKKLITDNLDSHQQYRLLSLTSMPTRVTTKTASVLDPIFVSPLPKDYSPTVLPSDVSDHSGTILTDLTINVPNLGSTRNIRIIKDYNFPFYYSHQRYKILFWFGRSYRIFYTNSTTATDLAFPETMITPKKKSVQSK